MYTLLAATITNNGRTKIHTRRKKKDKKKKKKSMNNISIYSKFKANKNAVPLFHSQLLTISFPLYLIAHTYKHTHSNTQRTHTFHNFIDDSNLFKKRDMNSR